MTGKMDDDKEKRFFLFKRRKKKMRKEVGETLERHALDGESEKKYFQAPSYILIFSLNCQRSIFLTVPLFFQRRAVLLSGAECKQNNRENSIISWHSHSSLSSPSTAVLASVVDGKIHQSRVLLLIYIFFFLFLKSSILLWCVGK